MVFLIDKCSQTYWADIVIEGHGCFEFEQCDIILNSNCVIARMGYYGGECRFSMVLCWLVPYGVSKHPFRCWTPDEDIYRQSQYKPYYIALLMLLRLLV